VDRATRRKEAISASGLVLLYEGNEIEADRLAKGKTFDFQGRIDSIGRDILGLPFVAFGANGIIAVQCFFENSDEILLAKLQPGQKVYIEGTVQGKLINVLMDHCRLF